MKHYESLSERFNKSFTLNDQGCHEWNKAITKKGYGVIGIGSRIDGSRRTLYAHRVSWELYNGKLIPDGLFILHKCDNPLCVNVDHLFLGTAKQNTEDMYSKNRASNKKGVIPSNFIKQVEKVRRGRFSKLNIEQVNEIKKSLASGVHYRIIADQYNVSAACISDIKRKATWINP